MAKKIKNELKEDGQDSIQDKQNTVSAQDESNSPNMIKTTEASANFSMEKSQEKKRTRHRQTVKLHSKKLSVSVICSNPYIRQFL